MDTLDCLIGANLEQKIEILFGTKKLIGINDLNLVDDDWKPAAGTDYPSYKEGISRGDNWHEFLRLKEDKAWQIAYDEWPYSRQGFTAHTHEHSSWKKVEALVGEEKTNEIFSCVQDDMISHDSFYLSPARHDTIEPASDVTWTPSTKKESEPIAMMMAEAQQKLLVNAIEHGLDVSAIPSVDAMMNRGSTVEVVLDEKMTSASGWLLPNGNYYGCGSMEHIGLAESLLKHIGSKIDLNGNVELIAESFGWVKISRSMTGLYVGCKKTPTKKQFNKLWDYSVLHKKDYEEMVSMLKSSKHEYAI